MPSAFVAAALPGSDFLDPLLGFSRRDADADAPWAALDQPVDAARRGLPPGRLGILPAAFAPNPMAVSSAAQNARAVGIAWQLRNRTTPGQRVLQERPIDWAELPASPFDVPLPV